VELSSSLAAARGPWSTQGRWSTQFAAQRAWGGGVLQAAVEGFYHPVRLRVVGSGLVVLDVEQAAEGGPQGGGELGPAV
jgi:hypothetical protein